MVSTFNPAQHMMSVVDFFQKVDRTGGGDGLVWAKATAPRGNQVIIEVLNMQGRRLKIPPIKAGDPICLSKFAPFEVLAQANDLVENVTNGNLKLMTTQEAMAFFDRKAKLLKTDVNSLMQKAHDTAANATRHRGLAESDVDVSRRVDQGDVVYDDEIINPKLEHLMGQVSPMLDDDKRASAAEIMVELIDLEDSLTLEELEYIRARGFYKSIKKWAEKKQAELVERDGGVQEGDDLWDGDNDA